MLARRGGHAGHRRSHRRASRAFRPVGVGDARPADRRSGYVTPGGPPRLDLTGAVARNLAEKVVRRAPAGGGASAGRRDRPRVAQGARGGGPLGARHLRRRRAEAGGAAGRSDHLPPREPHPRARTWPPGRRRRPSNRPRPGGARGRAGPPGCASARRSSSNMELAGLCSTSTGGFIPGAWAATCVRPVGTARSSTVAGAGREGGERLVATCRRRSVGADPSRLFVSAA